jgi:hypothetical protein
MAHTYRENHRAMSGSIQQKLEQKLKHKYVVCMKQAGKCVHSATIQALPRGSVQRILSADEREIW